MYQFVQPRGVWYAKSLSSFKDIHEGEHIAVGHDEFAKGAIYEEPIYDLSTKKGRDWAALIVAKQRIIIRPRKGNDMQSYDANHWGTLYEIANFQLTRGILFDLRNPQLILRYDIEQDIVSNDLGVTRNLESHKPPKPKASEPFVSKLTKTR